MIPAARFIYLVRDPIERAISHYVMESVHGKDRRTLSEALTDGRSPYVAYSRYEESLAPFLAHFDRSRLMVVEHGELLNRRRETMRGVFRFAGIDDAFWSSKMERQLNPTVEATTRRRIILLARRRLGIERVARLPMGLRMVAERLSAAGNARPPLELDPDVRARLEADLMPGYERLRSSA